MRYIVFSDVHGNLDALERVLEEARRLRPDIVVSLGDVIGYGADPAECIDLVQENAQIRLGGNHDLAAAGLIDFDDFNNTAKNAISWTACTLDAAHRDILERYDSMRRYSRCVFTHASPISPLEWEYVYTVRQAKEIFEHVSDKFIFIGHTHVPAIVSYNRKTDCTVMDCSTITLEPGCRYLINAGSIGQPRDGIAAASFALLDTSKRRLTIRRVPYDIVSAQEKIRSAGLPESLALRLATAR